METAIQTQLLNKIKPYQEKISLLEQSLTQKDNEVKIYKLAVERLKTKLKIMTAGDKSKKKGTKKRGSIRKNK